mmetsp:Transcript_39956/g.89695  ORF Transcript_39956/g.89695 Transcript_39956/m.89695 type:complete len:204 (+) Transcript_39956:301-912(+)
MACLCWTTAESWCQQETGSRGQKNGVFRASSGNVLYQPDQRDKIQLDVECLVKLLLQQPPNSAPSWTVRQLEFAFRNVGRKGVWAQNGMSLLLFLGCFFKTFHVFGPNDEFVRLNHGSPGHSRCLDHLDTVMVNLARISEPRLCFEERLHFHPKVPPSLKKSGVAAVSHTFESKLRFHDEYQDPPPKFRSEMAPRDALFCLTD